ncbi:Pro-Pol polyprotein [Elysia marginata]|uniref:Pro-Pol polyprotein n=1 Tax=Elysia marginata TaxID=1093978 RepID=A0AAV4ELX2_9GAST|nr:Pro-Pol polyprotein [Elysia marginata]
MVRACHSCQTSKIGRHTKTALNSFDPPDRRFGDIHVDLVGPFPPSEGCTYLFTIIDRFIRWPEAVPIQNAEAPTCARALLRNWIARFGVPDSITSDQGPQFTSSLWRELHNVLGCSPKHTTAYHPQSNGMVERFHRSLKAALKARLLGPGWMDELPIVLLGICSTWKEDLDAAPALLTYGTNLGIPGDFFPSTSAERISPGSIFVRHLQKNFRKLSPFSPVHHGTAKTYLPRDLMSAEQVYVRHDAHRGPLVRPYDGPFKVLCRSNKHFDILRHNKPTQVSIDRLKPAYSADPKFPPTTVQPPAQAPHPHAQAPRVDDNARGGTISDTQSSTRSGRNIKRPIRYRTILSARSF